MTIEAWLERFQILIDQGYGESQLYVMGPTHSETPNFLEIDDRGDVIMLFQD